MAGILEIVLVTAAAWTLFVRQARGWVWAAGGALYLALWPALHDANPWWMIPAWLAFAAVVTVLGIPALRLRFVSSALLRRFQRMMPVMSDTEREALEAGSVEGYDYSEALANSGILWTPAALRAWMEDNSGLMPGTKMRHVGIEDRTVQDFILAYLTSITTQDNYAIEGE